MSQGNPPKCTGRIARVRLVMRLSICSTSMLPSDPISASTGVAPTCRIACTVAQNVMGLVITSWPAPIFRLARAMWRAAVAELTAMAWGASTYSLNSRSKSATRGPVVSHPDLRVSTTSLISSSPIDGR